VKRHRRRRGRGPRRLFLRVYLFGVVLLIAVAVSVAAASHILWQGPSWAVGGRFARYIDGELAPLLTQPSELERKLQRVSEVFEVDLAVYWADGKRVAGAGAVVPAALPEPPREPRRIHRGPFLSYAAPLAGGRAYLVARTQYQGESGRGIVIVVLVLAVLALVSLPLARGLVRPLERITRAARALGAGDLSARTGICRRDEVGELANAFDEMAARLERMVHNEKELLANVSHELRTPLARIRVALAIAEEGSDQPDQVAAQLRGIGGDLLELDGLIEQVMAAARLDRASDGLPLTRTHVEVDSLVGDAAQRFAERHPGRELSTEVEPDLPALWVDGALVRRAIDNLLDNAGKYAAAEAGPVFLVAQRTEDSRNGFDRLLVVVRDRGIGVSEEDLARLFEPFFRSDKSRARGTGGVGLGLALCRRIVEAHGGRIDAELAPGGGLIVRFWLPFEQPS
jgi:signal transduction histidine kinase